jgi:hypothetical protein
MIENNETDDEIESDMIEADFEELADWFAEHRPEGISDEDWEIVSESCFPLGTLSIDMVFEIHNHPEDVIDRIRKGIENLRWRR